MNFFFFHLKKMNLNFECERGDIVQNIFAATERCNLLHNIKQLYAFVKFFPIFCLLRTYYLKRYLVISLICHTVQFDSYTKLFVSTIVFL